MPASSRSSLRRHARCSNSSASTSAAAITRRWAALARSSGVSAPAGSDGGPSPMRITRAASTERLPAATTAPTSRNHRSALAEASVVAESRAIVPASTRAEAPRAVEPVSRWISASGARNPSRCASPESRSRAAIDDRSRPRPPQRWRRVLREVGRFALDAHQFTVGKRAHQSSARGPKTERTTRTFVMCRWTAPGRSRTQIRWLARIYRLKFECRSALQFR